MSGGAGQVDYERFFDLALDLLAVAGLDGYFKRVSPSWTRVLGWSEAELLSRPVAEFMYPDDRERTLHARAELGRGVPLFGLENRYLCKDGSHRWLAWQSAVHLDTQTVYAIARDITERRQLEQEQLVFSKLESTGILAGGIAHDFNNLLGGMLLGLDMIPICGPLTLEQQVYFRRARESLTAANALTQQLVTFAKGGASEPRLVDLRTLLTDATEIALLGSQIHREFAIDPALPNVEVDEGQISQVISGLVMNAREAMDESGTVRIEAQSVELPAADAANQKKEFVRIRIVDSGSGIRADVLPKVFDPYFSTKARGARKGMGLGLTICRSVVQRHGGRIEIASTERVGTTVTCYLPAAPGSL